MHRNHKGQATVESAVLIATVVLAILGMRFYVERATSGGLKSNADSVGTQYSMGVGAGSISTSHSTDAGTDSRSCFDQDIAAGSGVPTDCMDANGYTGVGSP